MNQNRERTLVAAAVTASAAGTFITGALLSEPAGPFMP
jgi:hypothetical protein